MGIRVPISASPDALAVLSERGAAAARPAGVAAPLRQAMRRGVRAAFRARQLHEGEISLTLLGDAEIAELNEQYLQHQGPTDVISFALYEPGEPVLGDVYIGVAEAARSAARRRLPLAQEVLRLAVHGVLHVLGLDHPEGSERVRSLMWALQEQIVAEVEEQ